jgi:hypothetical protein
MTLEPKLSGTPQGHTYGRYVRVKPGREVQTLRIYTNELRYFWSIKPSSRETTTFDRRSLNAFGLGISLKAQSQNVQGTLSVRAIRFLGTPPTLH